MNKHQLAVVTLMLMAASACRSGIEPSGSPATVPIRAVYRNSQCLSDEAKVEPLRNAAGLADWWQPLARLQFPAKPLPPSLGAIDFDRSAAFVVFMGPRPTAGYDIELHDDRADVQRASLTIPASWREPAPGSMVAQVITNPCLVIAVPAERYESVTVRDRLGNTLAEAHF